MTSKWALGFSVLCAGTAISAGALIGGSSTEVAQVEKVIPRQRHHVIRAERVPDGLAILTPYEAGEPGTTLNRAESQAAVPLVVPDVESANDENLQVVYVIDESDGGDKGEPSPTTVIELDFPSPNDASLKLDQPHLSVSEALWSGGPPGEAFADDVREAPADGKGTCNVLNQAALCVEARSASSVGQSNPAYLETVFRNDYHVVVSGGDSLDRLVEVGASIGRKVTR